MALALSSCKLRGIVYINISVLCNASIFTLLQLDSPLSLPMYIVEG